MLSSTGLPREDMLARLLRPTALGVVLLLLGEDASGADAKTSSLSWLRMPDAEACVATQPLARAVEERLGRAVFVSASRADLSVEGRIERQDGGGWRAILTVRDARGALLGTRELERPEASCDTMTDPLALVIAVMIDPDAAMRTRPAPEPPTTASPTVRDPPAEVRESPATAESAPSDRLSEPGPRAPARPRGEPWRVEGQLDGTLHYGATPTVALGGGGQVILYPPSSPVGLRGYMALFYPTEVEADGARASLDLLYVGGSVCPTLRRRVSLLGCVGGQLGGLRPRAETPNRSIREALSPIVNAVAELRVHVPIAAPIGVAAGVAAGVPLVRPELDAATADGQGTTTLHRAKPYVLSADVGLGLFFP